MAPFARQKNKGTVKHLVAATRPATRRACRSPPSNKRRCRPQEARRKAGETIQLMQERGELATGKIGPGKKVSQPATPFSTLDDLGLTRSQSSRYQLEFVIDKADRPGGAGQRFLERLLRCCWGSGWLVEF